MAKRHRDRDREWDVFLSYARDDRAHAETLYDRLNDDGRVFLDQKSIPPGDDWPEAIDDALRHAMVIAVIVTPATDRAHFQKEEVLRALDQAKIRGARVVPVLIGDVRGDAVPFGLSRKQAIVAANPDVAARFLREVVERELQSEERRFAPGIRAHFDELHKTVDRLTAEQYRGPLSTSRRW